MLFKIVSYAPSIAGLSAIAVVTLLKNVRSRVNRLFFCLTIILAIWLTTLLVADLALSASLSLWMLRAAAFTGTLIIPFLLYFSSAFPVTVKRPGKYFHIVTLGPAIIFMLLAFTPLLVPNVEIRAGTAQPTELGLLYSLQSLYALIGFVASFVIMLHKIRGLNIRQRAQVRLMIFGLVVALLANFTTGYILAVIETANNYSNLVGSLSLLVFIGATSYAIVKHRLFDIRLAITRTIGFALTILVVGTLYSVIVLVISLLFFGSDNASFVQNGSQLALLIIPTIFVALTFHRIEQYIGKITRHIFYHDAYDLQATIDRLSDALVANNEVKTIMGNSLSVITNALQPEHAYFVTFDANGEIAAEISTERQAPAQLPKLLRSLQKFDSNPIVRDELLELSVPQNLFTEDVALALWLGPKQTPTGVLLLGSRRNGRIYTTQDIDLLRIGAKNLAVALENAKKYEQISGFAETLKDEVERATAKLRRANERLKSLDKLKDDFMSMASHQLRSPATSVHEALHMLNHPALDDQDRERLVSLAEASSERLVTVVTTMLNMARLQAGRFTIDRTEADLVHLTEKVIMQTSVVADQKGVKLRFSKPPKPVNLPVDMAKISEAMANYIENAIKYGPAKSIVHISLSSNDKDVRFEVTDHGMGVPEAERDKLFAKFYRATNARQEQPDGNGIGLYVVRSIAEGHGGHAYYRPLEKGSLFGFSIPYEHKID